MSNFQALRPLPFLIPALLLALAYEALGAGKGLTKLNAPEFTLSRETRIGFILPREGQVAASSCAITENGVELSVRTATQTQIRHKDLIFNDEIRGKKDLLSAMTVAEGGPLENSRGMPDVGSTRYASKLGDRETVLLQSGMISIVNHAAAASGLVKWIDLNCALPNP